MKLLALVGLLATGALLCGCVQGMVRPLTPHATQCFYETRVVTGSRIPQAINTCDEWVVVGGSRVDIIHDPQDIRLQRLRLPISK